MVAIGQALQLPSGFTNLVTTFAFKIYDGSDTSLTNLTNAFNTFTADQSNDNYSLLGEAAGAVINAILTVEIPTASENEMAYYNSASSFSRRRR